MKRTLTLTLFSTILFIGSASAHPLNFSVIPFVDDPYSLGGGFAKWVKGAGEGDANCQTNFGLKLEKTVPSSDYVAAGAQLKKLTGEVVLANDSLGYDISSSSSCTGGSPRFNVQYTLPDGTSGFSFVGGCATGTQTASTQNSDWTRVTFDLQTQASPAIPIGSTIQSVALIADETGRYFLDNIMFRGVYADKSDSTGSVPVCAF